jgi:hypothetical protein
VPEVEAPTFSDIRLIDDGKVVSPMRRPIFTIRKIPGNHLFLRLSRPQGYSAARRIRYIKKSISSGLELATLRLVAKCLN